MSRKILIRDLTLRDGQQSLFATRMSQDQIERVLPYYKDAGFYAVEVWGGAVPDSIMRFLGEDPWYRLESIKDAIGDVSKLTALSRGRNLFGYNPYPEDVIEGFNRNAVRSGIGIMRIFDCLNDVDNMASTIKYVKENGGLADCAVCYTVDPKFSALQRVKSMLKGKRLPSEVFTLDYFVSKAKEMQSLGADMITIKDMAGLIPPVIAGQLVRRLKKEIDLPVDFHTHCTPGYGLASVLTAMINGADIIDTNIMTFAGGPAAPSYEIIRIFAGKLGIETGVNLEAVMKIDKELRTIRKELADFDSYKQFPIEFDFLNSKLPESVDRLFDIAIDLAKADKEAELLDVVHRIEEYFNFVEPDEAVKAAEIPGGMYTNMLAQLKQLKLEHLLSRVLETVPLVRIDSGCPPLVTPTSQIVGAQAVNCVIDANNDKPFYTNVSNQFFNLVKGSYGKTPIEIDPDFREKICGLREAVPYDTSKYKKQDNPIILEKFGGVLLAENEKEELLMELFPNVAQPYLKNKKEREIMEIKVEVKRQMALEAEEKRAKYLSMTPEEKQERLLKGLENYNWGSLATNPDLEDEMK
jgi:pyruvate/oxaloacetate carboxyltransferase